MAFVQIIEFTTSQVDEVMQLGEQWEAAATGVGKARRTILLADRDHPGKLVNVVFFDSYDEAMENSAMPQTQEFAEKMQTLVEGEPTFHNLDVLEDRTLS